jgi:hypothetical protein
MTQCCTIQLQSYSPCVHEQLACSLAYERCTGELIQKEGDNMPAVMSLLFLKTWVCVLMSVHNLYSISCLSWHALSYNVCYFTYQTLGNSTVSHLIAQIFHKEQCFCSVKSGQHKTICTILMIAFSVVSTIFTVINILYYFNNQINLAII